MKPGESPKDYLLRKGWVFTKADHVWNWTLPPCPGQYMTRDALDLQLSMEKSPKRKQTKGL